MNDLDMSQFRTNTQLNREKMNRARKLAENNVKFNIEFFLSCNKLTLDRRIFRLKMPY